MTTEHIDRPPDTAVAVEVADAIAPARRTFMLPVRPAYTHDVPTALVTIDQHGGQNYRIWTEFLPAFTAICERMGLALIPYPEFRNRYHLRMTGLMNATAMQRRWSNRMTLRQLQQSIRSWEVSVADNRRNIRAISESDEFKTRPARLSPAMMANFIASLSDWPEFMEVGGPRSTLDMAQPKFEITASDTLGVRFAPMILSKRDHGRNSWMLLPPIAFKLTGAGWFASGAEHPHLYTGNFNLCVGDARFEYDNPMQAVPLLREWYQGGPWMGDAANHIWHTLAFQWWQTHSAEFFRRNPNPTVVLAPWAHRAKSRSIPLTREIVQDFVKGGGQWITDKAPTRPKVATPEPVTPFRLEREGKLVKAWRAIPTDIAATCSGCGQPAWLHATFTQRHQFDLCLCCAVALKSWDGLPHTTEPVVDTDPDFAMTLEPYAEREYNCAFPLCDDPNCTEHDMVTSGSEIATWRLLVPGFRTFYICEAHAQSVLSRFARKMPLRVDGVLTPIEKMQPIDHVVEADDAIVADGVAVAVEVAAPTEPETWRPLTIDPDFPVTVINGVDLTFADARLRGMVGDPRFNAAIMERKFGAGFARETCLMCGQGIERHELHECMYSPTGRKRRYTLPPLPAGALAPPPIRELPIHNHRGIAYAGLATQLVQLLFPSMQTEAIWNGRERCLICRTALDVHRHHRATPAAAHYDVIYDAIYCTVEQEVTEEPPLNVYAPDTWPANVRDAYTARIAAATPVATVATATTLDHIATAPATHGGIDPHDPISEDVVEHGYGPGPYTTGHLGQCYAGIGLWTGLDRDHSPLYRMNRLWRQFGDRNTANGITTGADCTWCGRDWGNHNGYNCGTVPPNTARIATEVARRIANQTWPMRPPVIADEPATGEVEVDDGHPHAPVPGMWRHYYERDLLAGRVADYTTHGALTDDAAHAVLDVLWYKFGPAMGMPGGRDYADTICIECGNTWMNGHTGETCVTTRDPDPERAAATRAQRILDGSL